MSAGQSTQVPACWQGLGEGHFLPVRRLRYAASTLLNMATPLLRVRCLGFDGDATGRDCRPEDTVGCCVRDLLDGPLGIEIENLDCEVAFGRGELVFGGVDVVIRGRLPRDDAAIGVARHQAAARQVTDSQPIGRSAVMKLNSGIRAEDQARSVVGPRWNMAG